MKTNMEYLKEFIEGNEEALEFLEAMEKERIDEVDELKNRLKDKDEEISGLESDLSDAQQQKENYEVIDCVIGTIEYRTDNLKLQSIMEDLKEQLEHKAKFGVLPETVEL
jgi:alanyl-tRNA synthetase